MREDPVPTFRRLGRGIATRARSAATTRRFWIRLGKIALGLVVLGGTGYVASLSSYPACKKATRQRLQEGLRGDLVAEWLDERELVWRPIPDDYRPGNYPGDAESPVLRSLFAPSHFFAARSGSTRRGDPQSDSWGYVRCETPFPFLVRTHFGAGVLSRRVKDGRIRGGGSEWFGVTTYVGAFGFVAPVYHWDVGSTFHF